MSKFIPLSVPNLKGNELEYITKAIETEWVSTAGSFITEFEKNTAQYVGAKEAVACQSGTAGLHLALQVCDVKAGDEVIVPTLTFIAAVNPVKYLGAEPVFMDCDDNLTLDVCKLEQFLETECDFSEHKVINKRSGRQIKAVVVVHVFGNLADMESLKSLTDRYQLKLIEDATEALGSYYKSGTYSGKYAGTIGDMGVYSFNGNKIITTGGGGMMVSNDEELLKRVRHLSTQAKSDELYYTHDEVGYNYRMTNLQAAVGLAQLEQLEDFIKTKENNYYLYKEKLEGIKGLSLLEMRPEIRSNYWFYALNCESGYPLNRDEMIQHLAEKKIQSRPIWGLIHEQKPYENNQSYQIEKAVYYREHIVNIPCSTNLEASDVLYVVDCIKKVK